MYQENPKGVGSMNIGSMNMGYVSDTTRIQTLNLFRLKHAPISLCHSDEWNLNLEETKINWKESTGNLSIPICFRDL